MLNCVTYFHETWYEETPHYGNFHFFLFHKIMADLRGLRGGSRPSDTYF